MITVFCSTVNTDLEPTHLLQGSGLMALLLEEQSLSLRKSDEECADDNLHYERFTGDESKKGRAKKENGRDPAVAVNSIAWLVH